MKTKRPLLAASIAASLFASSLTIFASPAISFSSERAVRIKSARIEKALGGGSYVTGTVEPSFGYTAPRAAHVHIAAYDASGKLLAEKVDKINGNNLKRWHLRPRPQASYVAFFPWTPAEIARVCIIEHSGHTHPDS